MQGKGHMSAHMIETAGMEADTQQLLQQQKMAISISFSQFTLKGPPGKFKRPCLSRSLRSERSVHHSEWILSVLLPEDQGATVKQNHTEKKNTAWTHNCLPFPNLIYHNSSYNEKQACLISLLAPSLSLIASPNFSSLTKPCGNMVNASIFCEQIQISFSPHTHRIHSLIKHVFF